MTAEIRTPIEDERTQVIDVLRTSLNFPRSWAEERGATTPLVDHRCAYVDGRIVATAAGYRFRQWFGGRDLMMSGVYAVATLPDSLRDSHATSRFAFITLDIALVLLVLTLVGLRQPLDLGLAVGNQLIGSVAVVAAPACISSSRSADDDFKGAAPVAGRVAVAPSLGAIILAMPTPPACATCMAIFSASIDFQTSPAVPSPKNSLASDGMID